MKYPYSKVYKLYTGLKKNNVETSMILEIMKGGEEIEAGSSPMDKSNWFSEAMKKMENLLDHQKRVQIRECCACNLGGKRLKLTTEIRDQYSTFEDRIRAANDTKYIFGHSVELMENGKIKVQFQPDNSSHTVCSCLPGEFNKLSLTYCYCCGGYVKNHLQAILGETLKCTVQSSATNSGGEKPCTFILERTQPDSV